jgi:hypothetical protein
LARRAPRDLYEQVAGEIRRAIADGEAKPGERLPPANDLAAAYQQLLQVERGWRDMNGALGLRPVFHHREDRIRAHVQLCRLALLLLRVVENATDGTWRNPRHELDRMHLVTLATPDGQVAPRSATTTGQKAILTALELPEPLGSSTSASRPTDPRSSTPGPLS